jgi:hypothetical protein
MSEKGILTERDRSQEKIGGKVSKKDVINVD